MKKFFSSLIVVVFAIVAGGCGAQKSQAYYDYESKIIAAHGDGSYTIRAWGRSRNATQSYEAAQKQALEDILFKGVTAQSSNLTNIKALVLEVNGRERHEDYFNAFFSDEKVWGKFVSMKDRRTMTSKYQRTDAQTLAQVTVLVYRAELKAKLQADGIIK